MGTASALFLLISKYGFTDVLAKDLVVLDPSRVAAQIVTGIGFIGGGLIFSCGVIGSTVSRPPLPSGFYGSGDGVLGAGLPLLALAVTVAYFVVAFVFPLLMRFLPGAWIPLGQTTDSTHD